MLRDGRRVLRTTVHAAVLVKRRRYEKTEEFKRRYAERAGPLAPGPAGARQHAGIEATNSELKRRHGLGRLRIRGFLRVRLAVHLKALACNVKRMVRYLAEKATDAERAAAAGGEAVADAASCVILHLLRPREPALAGLATLWRAVGAGRRYLSRLTAA